MAAQTHLRAGSDLGLDDIDDGRLSERRQVTELITLAGDDLAHDATHDLARTSLRHIRDDVDLLRGGEGTDDLSDLQRELLDQSSFVVRIVFEVTVDNMYVNRMRILRRKVKDEPFESDEGVDSLASELVVGTDDSCFSDTVVENEGRLDLSGRQAVTGDVDDIYGNDQ